MGAALRRAARVAVASSLVAVAPSFSIGAADVARPAPEIIARARTTNRTEIVTLRVAPAAVFASHLHIRSGGLSMQLVAVEVEFVDGSVARSTLGETLAPGQQSKAIAVDRRRAVSRVVVVKRPGLRAGETELQVLAVPVVR